MERTAEALKNETNVELYPYEMPKFYLGLITGRNRELDKLVDEKRIEAVYTVMGPSRWKPKVPHLVGFARCQAVIPESPYWKILSFRQRLFTQIQNIFLKNDFRKTSRVFWTENEFISSRVREFLPKEAKVFTVTSNYNQVYDHKEEWDKSIQYPPFDGMTFLTIAANYPHKNLKIIPEVIEYLQSAHPDMKYRFVMTLKGNEFGKLSESVKRHIHFVGFVTINQCPYMYEQSDVMFMPSLLECFSACYAEAMRMGKAILVPRLGFAEGLCKKAALYYDPIDVKSLGETMYQLYADEKLYNQLVKNGYEQIKSFETYETRAAKLLSIVENLPEMYNK
jgi:glycosyltransferase involved in cell wall biosynthesis